MPTNEISSGEYLRDLIKLSGKTHAEFYNELGIKKPYFYDIVSGRVNPPPYHLQFKAMEILQADESTREKFFDLAAQGRKEVPADIAKAVSEDPSVLANIRKDLKKLPKAT